MKIKLRTKLLTLVFISVLLSLGAAITPLILIFQNAQKRATVDTQMQIVGTTAEKISHFLDTQFLILGEAKFLLSFGLERDEFSQKMFMQGLLFRNDAFFDITLVDLHGNELVRENRYQIIKPSDLGNRFQSPEFQTTKEQGYYLGLLYFEGGRPLFRLGHAITDRGGRLLAIIIAEVDARIMQEVVRRTTIVRTGGRVFIVDRNGKVIAHPNFSEVLAKKDFSSLSIVDALKQDRSFSSIYQNEINEKVLGAWAPITVRINEADAATGWYVIAEESVSYALRHINRALGLGLASLTFGFILTVIGVWFVSRRIVRPLEKVHMAVVRFGQGDFSRRASVQTSDEIKDLADGFNQMAEDLKKHYLTLEEEKNKTLAIINNFTDGIMVLDRNNNLLLINPRAQSLLKFNGENLIGKPASELPQIGSFKPLAELLSKQRKRQLFRQEFGVNENLVLETTTVPVIREKKKSETLIILHDVTREKLIERMKSEFVSLVAHQLRTPLSAIKWTMRIILDEELGRINKEQRDFLEDSYQANERIIYLINDLLNVARIEEGRFLYEFSLTNIEELIESTIDSFKLGAEKKKIKLEFNKPVKKIVKIILDSKKMKMALENLIDNALRYNHLGGEAVISLKQGKKEIEVSIKDNGVGIPAAEQPRIFTKFFRGANVIRMDTRGSGLGLYIAKNIIEAHNGRIWFKSVEGKGTTFCFTLPIRKKV